MKKDMNNKQSKAKPGFLSVVQSTLAGLFGIQSEKNRQADFTNGSPINYIVSGLIATVILLVCMGLLVKTVVAQ